MTALMLNYCSKLQLLHSYLSEWSLQYIYIHIYILCYRFLVLYKMLIKPKEIKWNKQTLYFIPKGNDIFIYRRTLCFQNAGLLVVAGISRTLKGDRAFSFQTFSFGANSLSGCKMLRHSQFLGQMLSHTSLNNLVLNVWYILFGYY